MKRRNLYWAKKLAAALLGVATLALLEINPGYAQTIHLKTEIYPPFNMSAEDGDIIGISTEIVEQLFKRAGVDYTLELLPWQRAFGMALEEENTAVFSTTRTAERESKFRWVGPIAENNWVFLAKKSRGISVANLEAAKSLRVGGYQGDAVALYLADQGFDLDLAPRDNLNVLKIDRDRLDLWATGHLLGPYTAKQNGVGGLVPVLTFRETIMSIAFNINTDQALIDNLNAELEAMKAEGVILDIQSGYQ
jgi:polar amino acid transport system substrate-binding protein